MKKIQLTKNKYTVIDDEDYEYLNQYKWYCCKGKNTYYADGFDSNKTIRMHRLVMGQTGDLHIDHINGNGLDNRKENLRVCTRSQNLANSRIRDDNTSGVKGVTWEKCKKRWRARISINGRRKYLGRYKTLEAAKIAYKKGAKKYYGEFYSDGTDRERHAEVIV